MCKSYELGLQDGLAMYGRVCSVQPNCEECNVAVLRGEGLTCQEFMKEFPQKMASFLHEMDTGAHSYFDEYVTRFPNCSQPVEAVADMACRKALFEGDTSCKGGDCVACWKTVYVQDIEDEDDSDGSETMGVFCTGCGRED